MVKKVYDIYETLSNEDIDLESDELVWARRLLSDGLRLAGIGEDMSAWVLEVSEFFDR